MISSDTEHLFIFLNGFSAKNVSDFWDLQIFVRLNIAIPFNNLVLLLSTIWLIAVKHASLNFFQFYKDPGAYIGKFWDFVEVWLLDSGKFFEF